LAVEQVKLGINGYFLPLGENWVKLGILVKRDISNIIITPEILKLIADIDEFKGRWKVIENLAPERLSSLRRIATIESAGSSTQSKVPDSAMRT
jgi:hypothetical protein